MVNRYPGTCYYCGELVKKNAGTCWKPEGRRTFSVAHLVCDDDLPSVISVYIPSSGFSGTRNVRGLCEDAPCCGCCTF